MNKPTKNQILNVAVPVGFFAGVALAPVFTLCTAMGGALGFGCSVAYTNSSKASGGAGPIVVGSTLGGLALGAVVGLTATFNSDTAQVETQQPANDASAYVQQVNASHSLSDVLAQGYKNEDGKTVYLTLAA